MDAVIERMGLRVVTNTLEADWSSEAELEDVTGTVQIQILPDCILTDEVMEIVAPLMADESVADRLDGSIVVEFWKYERKADRIFLMPDDYRDKNARPKRQQPYGFRNSPTDVYGFGR